MEFAYFVGQKQGRMHQKMIRRKVTTLAMSFASLFYLLNIAKEQNHSYVAQEEEKERRTSVGKVGVFECTFFKF